LNPLKALTSVFFFSAGGAVQETGARAPEPVCVAQGAISSSVCGYFGHTEAAGGGGAAHAHARATAFYYSLLLHFTTKLLAAAVRRSLVLR
jgi:hypothetical protein